MMMNYIKNINGQEIVFGGVLVVGDRQVMNPTEEQLLAAGWKVKEEVKPTEAELLRMAKDEKLAAVDAFDKSEAVNSFLLNGVVMWLDFEERARLTISLRAYEDMGRQEMTKVFGGREFTFAIDVWRRMLAAIEVYASEALNVTERHRLAIEELTDAAAVMAYDVEGGYPKRLTF